MLVAGFPAGSFQTNCYVVAPAAGEECIVVDPGQDAVESLDDLLREHRLKPVAVLLTHGHIDHIWSVAPVCGARDVPAWIHPEDRELLADPAKGFSPQAGMLFGGLEFSEPDDVRELSDGAMLEIAGLEITVEHRPGHTRGSVTFRTPLPDSTQRADALFSGDLLFAGSIGRTDLPGGDYATILRSLAKTLTLPDETLVLPGHGPQTTIGRERATNPYLREVVPHDGPSRGL